MATKITTEETLFQKERRLKERKQSFKRAFKKGICWDYVMKDKLCKLIMQEEVIVRVHSDGLMDDDTEFINVTIEGYKQ